MPKLELHHDRGPVFDRIAHSAAPTRDLPTWVLKIPQVPSPWAAWYGHRRLCQTPFVQQRGLFVILRR
jgi:hypothetical protein